MYHWGGGGQYNNVEDIIVNSKCVYSLNKFDYQLQGELGNIYQWDNEKVISKVTRPRELGEQILDAHEINKNGRIVKKFQAHFNNDVRDFFLRWLKTEVESRLQGINNCKDTVNNAVEMEREITTIATLWFAPQTDKDSQTIMEDHCSLQETLHIIKNFATEITSGNC